MVKPSEKSPAMEQYLEKTFGRTTAIEANKCVPTPMGCGESIGNPREHFRDHISFKEYKISGLCQNCQDKVFGVNDK